MICVITRPKKTVSYKNVTGVIIPAISGTVQVLSGHAESFFLLKKGKVIIEAEAKVRNTIEIEEAECHVSEDTVLIIL